MTTLVTKHSSTASAVPLTSDLIQGELAVNVTDKRIYTEDATTTIVELGTNPSTLTTPTATVTGTLTASGTLTGNIITASTGFTGALTGAVTGDVVGNVTGNITGNVAGNVTGALTGAVTGDVAGNVTGNVTGDVVGNLTGNITGNVAGNVTAASGTTSLTDLVVNGTADFTNTKLVNVTAPTVASDAANKEYVDSLIPLNVYLGPLAADPTLDNQGAALIEGATYFNTTSDAMRVYDGAVWSVVSPTATTLTLAEITDFPIQTDHAGKFLTTDGSVPSWAIVDTDSTLSTLTKTFTTGEVATMTLSKAVQTPSVSVSKEVPQTGVSNGGWDVDSTAENYTRLDSAPATTLDWVGFDLTGAAYSQSFSVVTQEAQPTGVQFSTDGTKMFVVGRGGDEVNEYALSAGFDVSTASYTQVFSVAAQDSQPEGIAFSPDGTKMFIVGAVSVAVNEYLLTTAYDISTASFTDAFSVATQESSPFGIAFNTDGTKMFVVGDAGNRVNEYALTTGFDVSTASYTQAFPVGTQEATPCGIAFNTDGTRMFVSGTASRAVHEYLLTTGFDVSTASFVVSFSVLDQDTAPKGLTFNTNGTKMYVVGLSGDDINEYTIASTLALGTGSFASGDIGKTIEANSGVFVLTATSGSYIESTAPTSYAQVASGSWEMYGVVYNAVDGDLELSSITIGFDVSTAAYSQDFSVTTQEIDPLGLAFNVDGTKMFVCGGTGDEVNEYALSTAFDVSTSVAVSVFSVAAQDTYPTAIEFNTDGTKMFILGNSGQDVNEYALATGFDVTTASFTGSFSVSAQEVTPQGLAFNTDGTKMFVLGSANGANEYALSTGFVVASAVFTDAFSVAAQALTAEEIAFSSDGTKMLILDSNLGQVNEYALSTGFDVSTASFTDAFSVAAQDATPTGLSFNTDGTKMFVIGNTNDKVYEYSMGSFTAPSGYNPVHTTDSIDSTYWTDINSMTANQAAGDGAINYAISTDDRTTWGIVDNVSGERDIVRNNGGTWQYNSNSTYASETWANGATNTELATIAEAMEGASNLVGAFDVSTSVYLQSFSVASQDTSSQSIAFNADGTKMFILGNATKYVYEYALSTGFDVLTSSFTDSFYVNSQQPFPMGLAFNTSGTKMFVVGSAGASEYALTTGFDISTSSFTDTFDTSGQETSPKGVAFNADGTKMFIVGITGDDVNEYALTTGFDVSTASFTDAFSVASQETSPSGIQFNTDGTKMFVAGASQGVNEYTLTTGFDVSTASFANAFSVSAQLATPTGLVFNNNGTKMFVVNNNTVYPYSVGSTDYTNKMDKTQLDAVTDANHIVLGNDLDLAIVFNLSSGTTVPSSDGVAINYDANVLNELAVVGADYDADFPATDKVRITALSGANLKVRVV